MKLEEVLAACSKRLGLETLVLDEQGICRFSISETVKVSLERSLDEEEFYLYAPIGEMPARMTEQCAIQKKILEGNLFGRATGAASIGYDPESNLLILFQGFNEFLLNPHKFFAEFELFLGFLQHWTRLLEDARADY